MKPSVDCSVVRRIERTWAAHNAAIALNLAAQEPAWGSRVESLADGNAVFSGPGLFVNAATDIGLDGGVTEADFERLEAVAGAVGVAPRVDVGPCTDAGVERLARARGYRSTGRVAVLRWTVGSRLPRRPDVRFGVRAVDDTTLHRWQRAALLGWERENTPAEAASDAYSRAAFAVSGERLLLAVDPDDGRVVGCASLTVRDGLGSLGGMATLPGERRRGVQRALVRDRLDRAIAAGCDLIVSSTAAGSDSQRNLERLGFETIYTKAGWSA